MRRFTGFTLIEMLIVIVIIAILALIVIPKLMGAGRMAKDSTFKSNMVIIRRAIETFQGDYNGYPVALIDLATAPTQYIPYNQTSPVPIPIGTWKGPYLHAEGGIGGGPIPRNPYVAVNASVDEHWTYSNTSGTVTAGTGGPFGVDANGESYSIY